MSRIKRATAAAAFGYAHFGLALIIGIALVPLLLDRLGARNWGLWLATGELLAYAGMVDLGVLGILPWLLAEADGRRDRLAMRRLISSGAALGALIGCAYALLAVSLWQVLPAVLRLTPVDRATVGPPLAVVVGAIAITYPFRVAAAALIGLQDTSFYGAIRLVQALLAAVVTVVLLTHGYGLYALAWAAALPTLVELSAAAWRLRRTAPDLMTGWARPTFGELKPLVSNGFGVWLASFGWLMLSSSSALLLTFLGHPEWVPVFSCTAKVSAASTQLVWLMPDSGLVGLAQLYGELKASDHVRRVVGLLQQMHLLLAGAAACAVLAFNPTFVTFWVGEELFGGTALNGLLAIGIVLNSLVHGLLTAASVVGSRVRVGVVSVVNGAVQLAAALLLGHILGLIGLPLGGLVAACVTSIPAGFVLLRQTIGLSLRDLTADRIVPWAVRAAPVATAAVLVGGFHRWLGFWLSGAATALVLAAYAWQMRPLYGDILTLDPRAARWLALLKLGTPREPSVTALPAVNRS